MWVMAVAGWLRGDVDAIAIRMPSAVAVVLTSLLIYGYTRAFASAIAATVAATCLRNDGPSLANRPARRVGSLVRAAGRRIAAGLALRIYARHGGHSFVWTVGFALAALAALVKGPQAPCTLSRSQVCIC